MTRFELYLDFIEGIYKKEERCDSCWDKLESPIIEGPYGKEKLGPWCTNAYCRRGIRGRVITIIMGYKWFVEHPHHFLYHGWWKSDRCTTLLMEIASMIIIKLYYLIPKKVKLRWEIIDKLSEE